MTPLVSIIIPCHNAERWIGETLDSALAQTWPRIEIIVVDDGSTDNSALIAEARKGRGVQVIHQTQRGAAAARNTGLAHSRGDYVQFLDADDLLAPDKIAQQVARLAEAPPDSIASAAWARFRSNPAEAVYTPEPVWCDASPMDWLVSSWSGGGMMHPAAWLVPASILRAAGPWNETLSLDDDGEYFTRVLLASAGVIHCRDARVLYRTHDAGSLSQSKTVAAWHSSHEVCRLVQEAALACEDSPRVRRACAMNHLRFAFRAWPHRAARPWARASLDEARHLDPTAQRPLAGPRFERLARLIGWRFARVLQHYSEIGLKFMLPKIDLISVNRNHTGDVAPKKSRGA